MQIFTRFNSAFSRILQKMLKFHYFLVNCIFLSETFMEFCVMKARLQHSFDGHRARDTFDFLQVFSLQHFNFLLFSDSMFPFSYHSFQTDPQPNLVENVEHS